MSQQKGHCRLMSAGGAVHDKTVVRRFLERPALRHFLDLKKGWASSVEARFELKLGAFKVFVNGAHCRAHD